MNKVLEPHRRAALEWIEHVFSEDEGRRYWKHTWPTVKAEMVDSVARDIAQGDIVCFRTANGETNMFTIKLKRKFKKPTL